MRRFASYFAAVSVGLLAVAPPINYEIPLTINSFFWLYCVIAAGLLGTFLLSTKLHPALKALVLYIFMNSFLSQDPPSSFTAYILIVATVYFFLLCKECDYSILLSMVEAVFWLQILFLAVQYFGKDRLMCFHDQHQVFFGTVFQEMRLGSLFAIMSPLLLLKNKWYLVPLIAVAILIKNLGLAYSLATGVFIYTMFEYKRWRGQIILGILFFVAVCSVRGWPHIRVEVTEGRLPIWWVILKSWVLDTTQPTGRPDLFGISQTGPFQLDKFFFGHGADTFLPLFPYYKHDPNPFPQAHNDWLQLLWELGIIGFSIFTFWYCGDLICRLYRKVEVELLAGCAILAVNMFFAFPWRMTQTVLLMVVFVAFCERTVEGGF